MADQQFLASFGVDIDESGVSRLQKILVENPDAGGFSVRRCDYVPAGCPNIDGFLFLPVAAGMWKQPGHEVLSSEIPC